MIGILLILWACHYIPGDEADQFWNVFILGSVTWLLLVTAWVQVSVTNKQWQAMQHQSDLFNKQMDLMIRNECAYIGIEKWGVPLPEHDQLVIQGTFINRGRTPAWDFKRQFQVATGTGTPPPDWGIIEWKKPFEGSGESLIIAGGSTNFATDPLQMDAGTWSELRAGKQIILLDGACVYADTTGRQWIYEFGFTLDIGLENRVPKALERYQRHKEYNPN